MRPMPAAVVFVLLALCVAAQGPPAVPTARPAATGKITFAKDKTGIAVRCDGEPFTVYHKDGVPNPVLYPLLAEGGVAVTRNWPLQDGSDEPKDHEHHRSVWFAHGAVNGVDFWTNKGRIEQDGDAVLDDKAACIRTVDRWRDGEGKEVASDARRYGFRAGNGWRTIDVDVQISSGKELLFGDTKEGTMALRLRPELCLKGKGATAHILDSEGRKDDDVWGKRAAWVAYSGTVPSGTVPSGTVPSGTVPSGTADGQVVTVAMFDHPDNLRHPSWWHARDYGLVAANPFGQHDFEGGKPGRGDYTLKPGDKLLLRYCIYVGKGAADAKAIAKAYEDWLASVRGR